MAKLSKKDLKIGIPILVIGLLPIIIMLVYFIMVLQIKQPDAEESAPSSYVQVIEEEACQSGLL